MAPKYDDDEMLTDVPPLDESDAYTGGEATTAYFSKNDAPLTKTNFTVLMKLTGKEKPKKRAGLDLVMVLDVSGSMEDHNRIEYMKTAAKFVVGKLSPIDRLSVIKFSSHAERLCKMTQMKGNAQSHIEGLISSLRHGGSTNMTEALQEAIKVVKDRRIATGREVAIMFMSDGKPWPPEKNGTQVDVKDVPVYTFGLGQDTDHMVLRDIADRSKLGTFSTADVDNPKSSNLSYAFSQCLAGLLSVVVQDLTLTIKPKQPNSDIINVSVGKYQQVRNPSDGSITISFGNLYSQETRNILADLVLPEVKDSNVSKGRDILQYTYSYTNPVNQKVYKSNPLLVSVIRSEFASTKENPEVLVEQARQDTVDKMKTAMGQAEAKDYDGAKQTVEEARKNLKSIDVSNPTIKSLIAELNHFFELLEPGTYEKLGRAFIMAALLSHSLQRFAARGNVEELRMFATDALDVLLKDVIIIDPSPPPPTPPTPPTPPPYDPVKAMAEALSAHLGEAIKSLKAIQDIINNAKN